MAFFILVICRLFYLQVVKYDFYRSRVLDQRTRIIVLSGDRGDIFERGGDVLATSISTYSIFAIPKDAKNKDLIASKLSRLLGASKYSILMKISSNKHFVFLERKVSKALWDKIKAADLKGIYALVEKERAYTRGRLASQILGFVGVDNFGLSGIELGFDKYLMGVEGRLIIESDPSGRELVVSRAREIEPPTEGASVTLAIDAALQYMAEGELERAVKEHGAVSGTLIIMDVKEGDILAMASKPDFDPNRYSEFPASNWDERAVLNSYEPGSTFKLITAAAALEDGRVTVGERIYCPDRMDIGRTVIRNSHTLKPEEKSADLSEILQRSINTGAALVAMKVGEERFYSYIRLFGFGERTRIGIPGETPGIVRNFKNWSKPDIATISFGQGIAVTPLQMLSSVATIANFGIRVRPVLVKKIESPDGSFVKVFPRQELGRVISEKTAKELISMMEDVVERGTGKPAGIKGFRVGGKTGTAQKVRPGGFGYWPGHYVASFVGIAPASNPRLAAIVVIDDPRGIFWGETVAAPVFARVMEDALRYLNAPPDDIREAK